MPADGRFADRRDAGRQLADKLRGLDLVDPVVIALPRGGVPVAFEVAAALRAPLDVLVARKLGAPFQPELGVGAMAEDGVPLFHAATLSWLGLSVENMAGTVAQETKELARRVKLYRGNATRLPVTGRTAIVVDDGLATGATARAALRALRREQPAELVLAVPVGPPDAHRLIANDADCVVLVAAPARLSSVGQWYDDFTQTSDEEVLALLAEARRV